LRINPSFLIHSMTTYWTNLNSLTTSFSTLCLTTIYLM
jgi:hypothetical protein